MQQRFESSDFNEISSIFKEDQSEIDNFRRKYSALIRIRTYQINAWKSTEPVVLRIKDLADFFPYFEIDWIKFVNRQLLTSSQVLEEEEIWIDSPNLMRISYLNALRDKR